MSLVGRFIQEKVKIRAIQADWNMGQRRWAAKGQDMAAPQIPKATVYLTELLSKK